MGIGVLGIESAPYLKTGSFHELGGDPSEYLQGTDPPRAYDAPKKVERKQNR